ncbi:MAG: hypothetical protein K8F25_14170 [Fimbriimonadaceae bacterium]|nr:hypothetical protein [Alphaproteobacteria bacterium]
MAKKPDMLHGLLQILEANKGRIDSRIRIQKEAYLLAVSGFDFISAKSFSYHHYGPFSRELSDHLQFAVSVALLNESVKPGANDGTKYEYSLSETGSKYLEEAGKIEKKFADLVAACSNEHWRTLELAATSLFLQLNEERSEDEALSYALKLKPETSKYRSNAIAFLAKHFPHNQLSH